jgi:cell division protein FtsW
MKLATNLLVLCVLGLLTLGLVMLYSSSMALDGARYLVMQLVWAALGIVAATIMAAVDYRRLRPLAWPAFVVVVVLLVMVLIPGLGEVRGRARRWFNLGPVLFQPSELAKVAVVLVLAHYCAGRQRLLARFRWGLVVPGAMLVPVLALIVKEPDYGSTIILAGVAGVILLVAGVRWMQLLPIGLVGVTLIAAALWANPVRRARLEAWFRPQESKQGVGYQADQAMVALGAGGWTGVGLGNGRQKHGFVPLQHTDFIYSMLGEELGLVATGGVLMGFLVVFVCGVAIAAQSRDLFGLLLGTGLTFLIVSQAAVNIGVVTGALPNKGLPLPFISYGGSNLLMTLSQVGILLSIARRAEESEPSAPVALKDDAVVQAT